MYLLFLVLLFFPEESLCDKKKLDSHKNLAEWVRVNQDKLRAIRLSLMPELTVGHLDDDQLYEKRHITNDEDLTLREDLDAADSMIAERPEEALAMFSALLKTKPSSPRGHFGKARCCKKLALLKSSAPDTSTALALEEEAVESFCRVLELRNVPDFLVMLAGTECLVTLKAKGRVKESLLYLSIMAKAFPAKKNYHIDLGWHLLLERRLSEAKEVLQTLLDDHDNDDNLPKLWQVRLMLGLTLLLDQEGGNTASIRDGFRKKENCFRDDVTELLTVASQDPNSSRAMFGILANVYRRRGLQSSAEMIFEAGWRISGLYPSKWQRSAGVDFHVEDLDSSPVWTLEESGQAFHLERIKAHWRDIRSEGLAALFAGKHQDRGREYGRDSFDEESENLRANGVWQQMVLYENGNEKQEGCKLAPKTCLLLKNFTAATQMLRGQVKFSAIYPGTKVWPHTGPTNCRLRAHLGLVVPREETQPKMRIAEQILEWTEGEIFIIDDSFEHEVWYGKGSLSTANNDSKAAEGGESLASDQSCDAGVKPTCGNPERTCGNSDTVRVRLVLLIDFWHPGLTEDDISNLGPLPPSDPAQQSSEAHPVVNVGGEGVVASLP